MRRSVGSSRPEVASSSRSQSGRWSSVRAIASSCCSCARELLVPRLDRVEARAERCQADEREDLPDARVVEAVLVRGVGDRGAQRAERKIGPLREEEHALARRPLDPAGAEGPDSGEAAEERRLAAPRRTEQGHAIAGGDLGPCALEDHAPTGSLEPETVEPDGRRLGGCDPDSRPREIPGGGVEHIREGDEAFDVRAPAGDLPVGVHEPGERTRDLVVGDPGLHDQPERHQPREVRRARRPAAAPGC